MRTGWGYGRGYGLRVAEARHGLPVPGRTCTQATSVATGNRHRSRRGASATGNRSARLRALVRLLGALAELADGGDRVHEIRELERFSEDAGHR
jgi:hypothetical protein